MTATATPTLNGPTPSALAFAPDRTDKTTDSVVATRSQWLGRSIARTNSTPAHVVRILGDLEGTKPSDIELVPSVLRLIEELVHSSQTSQQGSNSSSSNFAGNIAIAMQWASQKSSLWPEKLREAVLLKVLIPLYLSTACNNARLSCDTVQATAQLLREVCALTEFDRCVGPDGFTEWLSQSHRQSNDPRSSLASTFRLSLAEIAESYLRTTLINLAPLGRYVGSDSASIAGENQHRGWWSLALQWRNRQTALTLPSGISVGVLDWSRLCSHWTQLYSALCALDRTGHETRSVDHSCSGVSGSKPRGKFAADGRLETGGPFASDSACATSTSSSFGKSAIDLSDAVVHREADCRFIEVRSSNDPLLGNNLDQLLQQCRSDQGVLAIVVVRHTESNADKSDSEILIRPWQLQFLEAMDSNIESASVRGFVTDAGELALVFENSERTELAQAARDSFAQLNQVLSTQSLSTNRPTPLIAGVSAVNAPSRSFRVEQLIESAWRCLDGAAAQGAGAVKSIEVF